MCIYIYISGPYPKINIINLSQPGIVIMHTQIAAQLKLVIVFFYIHIYIYINTEETTHHPWTMADSPLPGHANCTHQARPTDKRGARAVLNPAVAVTEYQKSFYPRPTKYI